MSTKNLISFEEKINLFVRGILPNRFAEILVKDQEGEVVERHRAALHAEVRDEEVVMVSDPIGPPLGGKLGDGDAA